jgi:hypothetical protein
MTIQEIAKEVIDGKWSSGNDRRQRLTRAGYNYQEVQAEVNRILKGGKAQKIIEKAQKEIGVMESPPNSNNVKYNTWYYGHEVSGAAYPWCAVFISWLFDGTGLVKKTASCADMLEWFEAHSQIVKNPIPGDLVFFRYSTNSRRTNHVGLVVDVKGNTITTIEGNTSKDSNDNGGRVMRRKRSGKIVGYARPKYD